MGKDRILKIGCCGFPVGRKRYYEHFNCVEIQQTFYHPPRIETLKRWKEEAPDGFEFTLKAWQLITHTPKSPTYRRLKMEIPEKDAHLYGNFIPSDEVFSAWELTMDAARALDAKIVVFQSPSSFKPSSQNLKNMREFFSQLDRSDIQLAWEPRGWPEDMILEVCKELDLIHVVDPFKGKGLWGKIRYFRLHGKGGYRYRYSEEDLLYLKERVITGEGSFYVMFNNIYMFDDAKRFKGL